VPRLFFRDHAERDLPTPDIARQNHRHVWIDPADPYAPELLNDARYYVDVLGMDFHNMHAIRESARWTVRALESAGVTDGDGAVERAAELWNKRS
jgi:hypothetical protein